MERRFYVVAREDLGSFQTISVAEVQPGEREHLPYLQLAIIPFSADVNGLPKDGELYRVCRIEDKVKEVLEDAGSLYLGHMTSGGAMTAAFHGPTQAPATIEVKTGLLKRQAIQMESRHDPSWNWFAAHMEPTPLEKEIDQNREHLRQLANYGDIGAKEREVDFFIDHVPSTRVGDLVKVLDLHDFKIHSITPHEALDQKVKVHLTKVTTVEQDTIAGVCAFMREQATNHYAIFDGWGCGVAK